jgi:hypothetical protein
MEEGPDENPALFLHRQAEATPPDCFTPVAQMFTEW